MSQPRLSRELAKQAVDAVSLAYAEGRSLRSAARTLGMTGGTLGSRLEAASAHYGMHPAPAHPPVIEETREAKPRVRIKAIRSPDDMPVYRVLGIGDAHDSPHLPDKSRFKWIARHAAETKPDQIVQIGDFGSFDSLSRHETPGSFGQKLKPSYANDLESLSKACEAIHSVIGTDMEMHCTLGNHEARVLRFEQGTAEIEGQLWQPLMDLFARYGWRTHEEGAFHFVGGCGFVHAPRTLMNREYGGKTLNAIGNDAMFSIVFGHSHRGQVQHFPKIGPLQGVTICNLGTCLPTNHVEQYARVAMTGWTYGTYMLTIQGGRIIGHEFISMDELERRYGD